MVALLLTGRGSGSAHMVQMPTQLSDAYLPALCFVQHICDHGHAALIDLVVMIRMDRFEKTRRSASSLCAGKYQCIASIAVYLSCLHATFCSSDRFLLQDG